jgi:hypothetical protein
MLRDADLSLANWLERVLPPDTGVRFDAPRADWESRGPGSAFVSAFLRTVCRDGKELPGSGWLEARDQDGRLVGRQPTARYFRLSYLVTAWAAVVDGDDDASRGTLEEHEMLGLLIDACTDTEVLPQDQLTGALAEAGLPCFVRCADEDAGRSTTNLWTGFGISAHTHLELDLVAPVVPPMVTELAVPAREIVLVGQQATPNPDAPGGTTASAGSGDAGRSDPAPPGRTAGTVRRWERSTIIEPTATGQPGRTPRRGG